MYKVELINNSVIYIKGVIDIYNLNEYVCFSDEDNNLSHVFPCKKVLSVEVIHNKSKDYNECNVYKVMLSNNNIRIVKGNLDLGWENYITFDDKDKMLTHIFPDNNVLSVEIVNNKE